VEVKMAQVFKPPAGAGRPTWRSRADGSLAQVACATCCPKLPDLFRATNSLLGQYVGEAPLNFT
jgi:hypothetical protein